MNGIIVKDNMANVRTESCVCKTYLNVSTCIHHYIDNELNSCCRKVKYESIPVDSKIPYLVGDSVKGRIEDGKFIIEKNYSSIKKELPKEKTFEEKLQELVKKYK